MLVFKSVLFNMSFEKIQISSPDEEDSNNKTRAYKIEIGQTPTINTNIAGTGAFIEAHKRRREPREIHEEKLKEIRNEIMSHYGIDKSDSISIQEGIRDIRAFVIINSKDPERKAIFFADGNVSHKDLLIALCNNFEAIGIVKDDQLPPDFLKKWEVKKGFIDPSFNGFNGFSELHGAYLKVIEEKHKEEISGEDLKDLQEGRMKLPDWFVVG